MTLHFLRPTKLAGFLIDYRKADPEIGGVDVFIWRDARRDDGFMIHCHDWGHAHRLLTDIKKVMEGQ